MSDTEGVGVKKEVFELGPEALARVKHLRIKPTEWSSASNERPASTDVGVVGGTGSELGS